MAGESLPPPATSTVASGNSVAVEWYMRGLCIGASVVHARVVGFHNSGRSGPATVLVCWFVPPPPTTSTLPSGRLTMLWNVRANAIGATVVHAGVGWFMSSTAVVVSELVA